MNDFDFLNWIADRFVYVIGESPNVDFVQRLREVAGRNERVLAERDAWKTLHDAKGHIYPYAYASQKQLNAIEKAKGILGMI